MYGDGRRSRASPYIAFLPADVPRSRRPSPYIPST